MSQSIKDKDVFHPEKYCAHLDKVATDFNMRFGELNEMECIAAFVSNPFMLIDIEQVAAKFQQVFSLSIYFIIKVDRRKRHLKTDPVVNRYSRHILETISALCLFQQFFGDLFVLFERCQTLSLVRNKKLFVSTGLNYPSQWNRIFKSRLVQLIMAYGNTYFIVLIFILTFLLIDAGREVRKYSVTEKVDLTNNPVAVEHIHMKLFRAQRNLYIAGFALLLWFLLRRLVTLLSQQATFVASNEAFKKQALSASDAAKKYMEENEQLRMVYELVEINQNSFIVYYGSKAEQKLSKAVQPDSKHRVGTRTG
ncbi:BAP31 protein, partial [Polypterus senegalus]